MLLKALLLSFGLLTTISDANAKPDCPAPAELATQIEARITTLEGILQGLKAIQAGRTDLTVPHGALFTVDLEDEAAIRNRVLGLKAALDPPSSHPAETGFPQKCLNDAKPVSVERLTSLAREIATTRMEILSLPEESRRSLLQLQAQAAHHDQEAKSLQTAGLSAEAARDSADASLKEAEAQAQEARSVELRELASHRSLLERARRDVAELGILWTKKLQERSEQLTNAAKALSEPASALARTESRSALTAAYEEAARIWRGMVDTIISTAPLERGTETLPGIPATPEVLLTRLRGSPEAEKYLDSAQSLAREREELQELRHSLFNENQEKEYKLLLSAGRLRSLLMERAVAAGDETVLRVDDDYVEDLIREVQIVPYRPLAFFKSKVADIRRLSASGVAGLIQIVQQLFILAGFVLIPSVALLGLNGISSKLNRMRELALRQSHIDRGAATRALWIHRLSPFVPWAGLLVITRLASGWIQGSTFTEAAIIFPYFEYYFLYRIFRILIANIVARLSGGASSLQGVSNAPQRIEKTARLLGLYLFIGACLLHAAESVVRQALVYRIVSGGFTVFGFLVIAYAAWQWKEEIADVASAKLPDRLATPAARIARGKLSFFGALLILIAVLVYEMWLLIWSWIEGQETAKRLSARIYRRRLESAARDSGRDEEESTDLSPEYLKWFELGIPTDESLLIQTENPMDTELRALIRRWNEGEGDEHSAAIHGDKGIGKSCLLHRLAGEFTDLRVIQATVPARLTSREQVLEFFENLLKIDLSGDGARTLSDVSANMPKTVVLLDDCQNLFLGKRDGFSGLQAFIDLVNARTSNLFWCAAFNRFSWAYLSSVCQIEKYFRWAIRMPTWTDTDIKNLILERHQRSGFSLRFDPVIFATHTGDSVVHVQDRFFGLLWEQSRGTPRAALLLWLSALRSSGKNTLRVGLPDAVQGRVLSPLRDDELFVYAAVARHENLSTQEAVEATSLPEAFVRHALKLGLEQELLTREAGRYRVAPVWQWAMIQHLAGKNFIYE